uniref:ALMS motif domain-containing protein n=1 Tax=Knipowitschia caucasica TaxID=637954 RepID=A0AAV2JN57_KNICA
MSEVHNTATAPHCTEAHITEAKDIATSVHKNALSVWQGHKEKKSVSFAAAAPAASSQSALSFSYSSASSLLRTGSVPDVEALELFRPDFISRSQSRLQQLELRTRTRTRTRTRNGPGSLHGLGEDPGKHWRNCTTPDSLSDNLFKPRERTISGREMQLRSRR